MAHVLIVDDTPANREVLIDVLADEGYRLDEAADGIEAMDKIAADPPDVILLDVMMPHLDGVECCRRIKASEHTAHIPVVMITALSNEKDAVQGLNAGATDYISKPFSYPTVRARVQAALRGKIATDQLADRNREILNLAFAMTHDLQTPLASLSGAAQSLTGRLAEHDDPKVIKWIDRIHSNADRMVAMLDDLMAYARAGSEQIEIEKVDLCCAIRQAIDAVRPQNDGPVITFRHYDDALLVMANAKALVRVLTNLIGNAVKYSVEQPEPRIDVRVRCENGAAQCAITDNGCGIPASQIERVLLPFRRANANIKGTGLGLAIVKRYVDAFGGRIRLESDGSTGTTAHLELSLARHDERVQHGGKAA